MVEVFAIYFTIGFLLGVLWAIEAENVQQCIAVFILWPFVILRIAYRGFKSM